jgi:hypothetical protein
MMKLIFELPATGGKKGNPLCPMVLMTEEASILFKEGDFRKCPSVTSQGKK